MYLIIALISLGALIFIHEFGHYCTAKACGVAVQEFSLGMGPSLLQHKGKDGTLYSLRLLPVGGFCAFYDEQSNKADAQVVAFARQPVYKRFLITLAGPLVNFIVAIVLISFYLCVFGYYEATTSIMAVDEHAAFAGLRSGDTIVAINDMASDNPLFFSQAIAASEGKLLSIRVKRGEEFLTCSVEPYFDKTVDRWRIGVSFKQNRKTETLLRSLAYSVHYNLQNAGYIFETIKNLLFKHKGVEELTGPIGTVYVIMEETRQGGVETYIELLALISLNLAVFNLLPIPGLDGSRLLLLLVERICHKPLNEKWVSLVYMVGLGLLLVLILILSYKDIGRFILR